MPKSKSRIMLLERKSEVYILFEKLNVDLDFGIGRL